MVTLPLVLSERGFSTAVYGALISVNGLVIIAAEFWISGRTRRYPPHRVMALGGLLLGGGFALTPLAGASVPLLIATVLVWTLGEMLGSPTGQAYLSAIAPPDLRGRYAGATGLAWSLAFTVGPLLGSTALALSPVTLWLGSVALAAGSAALFLTLPPAPVTTTQPLPPGAPSRPGDPAPVAPGTAVPEPRGRLVPRFARPRQ
jgi:MFS family permease